MKQPRFFFLTLSLFAASACAGGTVEEPPEDDDSTSSGTGGAATGMATGGSDEGGSGGGGTGGDTGLCDVDCSSIQTPDCSVAVCNEGDYPGTVGACVVVNAENGVECDDGLFCTVNDACFEGVCTGGPQNDCGMTAPPCNSVTCDETSATCSVAAADDGDPCSDPNNLCVVNATCQAGACTGGSLNDCFFAPVPNDCHVAVCNPSNGMCEPVPGNDGDACVDQNDLCTVNKVCSGGACSGGVPTDCSALDVGCTVGVCDTTSGQCMGQAVPMGGQCFDGIGPCETGTCDGSQNCVAAPVMNGTSCDDFNICTLGDTCNAGVCTGSVDPNCTTYFQAVFETCPPAGWTLNPEWECGAPTNVGPAAAIQGTGLLGTDLDDDYDNNRAYASSYAQTPPIALGIGTGPVLSYSHYVDTEGSVYDGYNLKISTDGGATWSVLTNVDPPYNLTVGGEPAYGGHAATWETVSVNLGAYTGQQVLLRWSFRSDGSVVYPGIYIDDIEISDGNTIPVVITTPSLPDGLENVTYGAQLDQTGGTGNGVWTIEGGTNINWLAINGSTGALSGTPSSANVGPVTVTIRHTEPTNPTNFDEVVYSFNVQTTIYTDDIEAACPGNWTLGGDWQCGTPTSGPLAAFSGTQLLGTVLGGNYNNNNAWTTATATSGPISLAGTTAPILRFQTWYRTEGSVYDGFNVKVSTDGVNYTLVSNVTPAYNLTINSQPAWGGNFQQWNQYSADLSAYAGQSVYVQFGFRTDGSVTYSGVYIDDVVITD